VASPGWGPYAVELAAADDSTLPAASRISCDQYWGKAIYLSQSIADDHQSVAATLIHELGHEFGFTDSASDEAQLEFFASLCRM
jgi:hypothetical protein